MGDSKVTGLSLLESLDVGHSLQFVARPSQETGGGAASFSKAHLLGSRVVARGYRSWLWLSPWRLLVLRPPQPRLGEGGGAWPAALEPRPQRD